MPRASLQNGLIPSTPFLLFGQYAMGDPTRAPAGCETAWAYAHVPQEVRGDAGPRRVARRVDDRDESERFAERIEAQVDALAPASAT